jgi:hypothetical protein
MGVHCKRARDAGGSSRAALGDTGGRQRIGESDEHSRRLFVAAAGGESAGCATRKRTSGWWKEKAMSAKVQSSERRNAVKLSPNVKGTSRIRVRWRTIGPSQSISNSHRYMAIGASQSHLKFSSADGRSACPTNSLARGRNDRSSSTVRCKLHRPILVSRTCPTINTPYPAHNGRPLQPPIVLATSQKASFSERPLTNRSQDTVVQTCVSVAEVGESRGITTMRLVGIDLGTQVRAEDWGFRGMNNSAVSRKRVRPLQCLTGRPNAGDWKEILVSG